MKKVKKIVSMMQRGCFTLMLAMCSIKTVFAKDLLVNALNGDIKDTLGSNSKFWGIFILIDIVLGTAAAVATKNPKVFLTVFGIAFIPAFLIKTFVF